MKKDLPDIKPVAFANRIYGPVFQMLREQKDNGVAMHKSISGALWWWFTKLTTGEREAARNQMMEWCREQIAEAEAQRLLDVAANSAIREPARQQKPNRNRKAK